MTAPEIYSEVVLLRFVFKIDDHLTLYHGNNRRAT